MTSREQQLAEAILPGLNGGRGPSGTPEQGADALANAVMGVVNKWLVAAERAGYERCKRDAATAITTLADDALNGILVPTADALDAVARLGEAAA